ncbi:MAG: RHS repeat protein [bacterium]|nr:RHS repeat protein [bacterium]
MRVSILKFAMLNRHLGMLEQVIQKGGGSYAVRVLENYGYNKGLNEVPVLKDIIAPDGTRLGTFEYDSQGRKTGLIDHEGNRVLFGYDAPEHHYTVTDRRGNPTEYTYDSDGNVTSVTDAEGNSESYSYNKKGRLLAKTNKLGYTNAFTYDDEGNLLTETDPLGNSMTYTYDAGGNRLTETNPLGHMVSFDSDTYGNLLSVKNALGHITSFSYNADGLKDSTTDALGQTSTYGYDSQGNLTTITDPLGYAVTSTYDVYGNALTVTDKEGLTITNEYDGQGKLVRTTDQDGKVHEYTHNSSFKIEEYITPLGDKINNSFDPNGNLTVSRDPSGHEVQFDYDPNGNQTTLMTTISTENGLETFTIEKVYDALNRMTEEIDGDGRSLKAEYDALGRPTARIDKQGNRVELQYNPRGMLTGQTLPDGRTISSSYDAAGRMTAATDARGALTQYDYNAANKLLTATYHNGTAIDHEYDALGRLVSMSSSQGQSFQMAYDPLGRIQSQTDVLGRVTQYDYSPGGRLTKTIDPRGHVTEYEYNDAGAVTKVTLPNGSSISYTYDGFGRKSSETDPYGRTTFFEWTATGQLKNIIDPAGHATEYRYNDIGYLIAQTDANGHTTRYEYDKLGRMIKKTLPLGMSQTYSYGERSVTVADFNGETTEYEVDLQGRISQVRFSDGTSISSTYTASGELSAVTDRRGTTTFVYDDRGRVLRRVEPDGRALSYSYDSFGRLTSVSVPSGTTSYAYDDLGRLSRVTDPDGQETSYTYNQDGNVESVSSPNDTEIVYGYDSQNRVTSVEHRRNSGERLARYTATFGAKGERLSVEEDSGRRVVYHYDRLGQLIEETITEADGATHIIGYSYDPVGNRLTKDDDEVITTYTYDENDRLLTENGYSYTYDENGNMLTKSGNGENRQFAYNVQNHLVRVEREFSQGSSVVEYRYDYEGIRVGKTIDGTQITTYLVDKNRPYAQVLEAEHRQGALSATVNYVYGHSLISQSIDGTTSYYHHDGSQSVRALSDPSGTLSDTYDYDAYGNLLRQSGDTQNPYRYRSEAFDPELDAYYLRARYYQPGSGRFSSIDPVEGDINVPRSLHRYLYAYNDPVNRLDPSGGMTLSEGIVTAGIIGMLSGTTVGYAAGEFYEDVYLDWGENLFPDAGIMGISAYGKLLNVEEFPGVNEVVSAFMKDLFNINVPPTRATLGGVFGAEAMFSFGSSQLGAFWYGGFQGEAQMSSNKRLDTNMYTGYVWNLWNCDDYKGVFMALNTPLISRFWDPEPGDMLRNLGPWGYSWSVGSLLKGSSTTILGANFTLYKHPITPKVVPYGGLAFGWVAAQSGLFALSVKNQQIASSVFTFIGGVLTGAIAKSKDIYNRSSIRTKPNPVQTLHTWRSSNVTRPKNKIDFYRNGEFVKRNYWRSGPRTAGGYISLL